jgi:muramidase (phage lysozyme)
MARDPQKLRKAYEYKLGKDLVAKLSDDQITQLSKYYNSLPPDQQSKVDSEIVMGKGDFLDTARSMADPIKNPVKDDTLAQKYLPEDKFVDDTQEKLDEKLSETSDSIMDEIDRIIEEYNKKVASYKETKEEEEEKIPEGLDDLLNDIKEETKKEVGGEKSSSALAVIPKKIEEKGEELVDEDIDPRILKLLGIEDTTGLDYSDYKTLLKEKMTADRMSGQDVDSGDAELISNEFKRVKGSTGKFKVNGQKIKAESFVGKKKTTEPVSKVRRSLLMPSPSVRVDQPIKDEGQSNDEIMGLLVAKLNAVDKNVQNTAENLKQKDEIEEKEKEKDRIAAGKVEDSRREEKIERKNVLGNIVKGVKKGVKPIGDMLGGLFDFFKKIGFSIFIMELLRFLENPAKFINGIVKWVNLQIAKLEETIENFVIDNIIKPLNNVIGGLNTKIKEFVTNINNTLAPLKNVPGLGNVIQPLPVPEVPLIDENIIKDKVFLGRVPEVEDDFMDGILGIPNAPPAPVLPAPGTTQPSTGTTQPSTGTTQPSTGTTQPSTGTRVNPQTPMVPTSGGLTPQQKAFAETVAYAEGTAGNAGYNTWFGGSEYAGDLSRYTINQVVELQKKFLAEGRGKFDGGRQQSAAVGKYQMIEPELYAAAAGLNPAVDKFTPENQDKIFLYGYVMKQAGVTEAEINAPTMSDETIDKLAPVFASFPNLIGPDAQGRVGTNSSYYGQGGKTAEQIRQRFQQERSNRIRPTTVEPPPVGQTRSPEVSMAPSKTSLPKPVNPPVSNVSVASMTLPGAGVKVDNSISSAGASQTPVLAFSATDPTNLSVISAKSTYGVVV